jgi:hypothetical protein
MSAEQTQTDDLGMPFQTPWPGTAGAEQRVGMSRFRLLLPAVTVVLGATMLAIPWVLPFEHGHGKALVFVVAGAAELVLGATLAYLILHEPADGGVMTGPSDRETRPRPEPR